MNTVLSLNYDWRNFLQAAKFKINGMSGHERDTITNSKPTRMWLIENYARGTKENGSVASNSSNTMENTLKLPYRHNVSGIFYSIVCFCLENININDIYRYICK